MEAQLILAAQSGDERALAELIRRYDRRVYRLAYSFLHNVDDAADVVQEVFLRAYRNLSRFDTTRAFYPWLYRITRNLCINKRNLGANKERTLPADDLIPSVTFDPLTIVVNNEEIEALKNAICLLPDLHREILLLKHFQECSYADIAEILGIPIGTVMSRLFNARKKLKSLLVEVESEL